MMRHILIGSFTALLLAAGCASPPAPEEEGQVTQAMSGHPPIIDWLVFDDTSDAHLTHWDEPTGVLPVQTLPLDPGWRVAGVAGTLLLQHDGSASKLYELDGQGNVVGSFPWPPAGQVAPAGSFRTLSLDQAGTCPIDLSQATYTLVRRETTLTSQVPVINVYRLDAQGNTLLHEPLPIPSLDQPSELRDFRRHSGDIYMGLFTWTQDYGGFVVYYLQNAQGGFEALRLDTLTGAEGLVDCKELDPRVVCVGDDNDEHPGAQFRPTSFLRTYREGLTSPAQFVLWSRDDGEAALHPINIYTGKLDQAAAVMLHPSGIQGEAAAISGGTPEVCPIMGDPEDPPPEYEGEFDPGDPCPICQ